QFALMVALGLREDHTLLDIGCGSLCGGRLFIPYLLPGGYFGIEPQAWLVEDGFKLEVGEELRRLKRPVFRYVDDFSLTAFDVLFDFMLAQSVLTHVSQAQLDRCLSQAKLALKPEGLFAASFFSNGRDTYSGDDWIYPGFAPYPVKSVVERARRHGLTGYPLIWRNGYDHYWMVFAHEAHAGRVSWLGELSGEQRMLRILELAKELDDLRVKYAKTKGKLKEADLELSKLRGDKRHLDDPS
ncbi:MAG: class I SAM-dependent methyltransferase, partial [Candidatus Binataceae bacterium]